MFYTCFESNKNIYENIILYKKNGDSMLETNLLDYFFYIYFYIYFIFFYIQYIFNETNLAIPQNSPFNNKPGQGGKIVRN